MKRIILGLSFLCCITSIFSQTKISVVVSDSTTNLPLPFALVYLKSSGLGMSTNFQGEANLMLKDKKISEDTLVISYVGYEEKRLPINCFENQSVKVSLVTASKEFPAVDVVYKKPIPLKKILKNVLKNTKENYSESDVGFEGFYRELIKENDQYTILNEAIVNLYYTGYTHNSIDLKMYKKWQYDDSYAFEYKWSWFDGFPIQFNSINDKASIVAARTSETSSNSNLDFSITGGPLSLTAKDYVKYRYDFLNPKTFSNYKYEKRESEIVNGENCYVIYFSPKEANKRVIFNHIRKNQNSIYVGNMYIDKKSFAVVRIKYQLVSDFDYGFYQNRVPLDYQVTVDYKKAESNKWYLNKIALQQTRLIYNAKTQKRDLVNAYQELYITEIDTVSPQQIPEEKEWKHTQLTQLRTYELPYDSVLWSNVEKSGQYPQLASEIKDDLEAKKSLNKQFKSRFKQRQNLPKPIAAKEKFVFNYPFEALLDNYQWFANPSNVKDYYNYLEEENEYASNYLLPNKTYQRDIFKVINTFYVKDTTEKQQKHQKGDYNWEEDSLQRSFLYEYLDTIRKVKIFDWGTFKRKRKNCFMSLAPKMTTTNLAFVHTENGGLNNQLMVMKKGNSTPIDSISEIYSFEWFNDSLLLYTKRNDAKRSDKLLCRNINTRQDSLLLFESDLTYDISVSKTMSYLVCTVQSMDESEIHLADKKGDFPAFVLALKREPNITYLLKEFNKQIYVLTNKNALNNKLCLLENGKLKDVVSHQPKVFIDNYIVTDNYMVLKVYQNSFLHILYKQKNTKKWKELELKKEIYDASIYRAKNDEITMVFSSPNTPYTVYSFDLSKQVLTKKSVTKIEPRMDYYRRFIKVERVWAKSNDGVKIPMLKVNNSSPKRKHKGLILKAYGMYGSSYGEGSFNMEDFVLMEEGYTIVYALVRGGGLMGKQWYLDGKLLNKENTFNDYITCAEFLIDKGYTDAEHLVGYGNSAGGLLMGVVINRRPELFNTVILDHPYLDPLTTMMMDTLPLTTDHYKEVGNPNNQEVYAYMKAYSPYHNINKQAYPNLLFIASSNDYQTPTWQIAKYVAKLRASNTGTNAILFKTDFGSGHIGSTQGDQWKKDLSFKYTFIYNSLFKE